MKQQYIFYYSRDVLCTLNAMPIFFEGFYRLNILTINKNKIVLSNFFYCTIFTEAYSIDCLSIIFEERKPTPWIKIYTNRNSKLHVFLNSRADDFEHRRFLCALLYSSNSVCQIVQRSWYRQTEGCSEFELINISYFIDISLHITIISLKINIDIPFAFVLKPILYQLSYLKHKNCFWTIFLRLYNSWCGVVYGFVLPKSTKRILNIII